MTTRSNRTKNKAVKKSSSKRVSVKGKLQRATSRPRKTNTARRKSKGGEIALTTTSDLEGVIAVQKISGLKGLGLLRVGRVKKLELRDRLGMARPMFGRIVNVAERTIAKVESGDETPDKLKRPYNEVYRLWQALSELVESESLGLWFQTPNESLDGLKPIEVIERGEVDRLWEMVYELQTGMPG